MIKGRNDSFFSYILLVEEIGVMGENLQMFSYEFVLISKKDMDVN